MAIQRTRASGPTWGANAPTSAAAPRITPDAAPVLAAWTSATTARTFSGTTTRSTVRCPTRSARDPWVGPPSAVPTAAAALASPPRASEPVVVVTRSRVPIVIIENGSRARNAMGRNALPARRGSSPYVASVPRRGSEGSGAWAGAPGAPPVTSGRAGARGLGVRVMRVLQGSTVPRTDPPVLRLRTVSLEVSPILAVTTPEGERATRPASVSRPSPQRGRACRSRRSPRRPRGAVPGARAARRPGAAWPRRS